MNQRICQGNPTLPRFPAAYAIQLRPNSGPDIRTLRSPGRPDAPILRTSGRSSIVRTICPLAFHLPDVPPAFRTFQSVGPSNFRLPDPDPHLGFRTRFPDPSNEPRTSRSSSQHFPSSLLFPPPHSPDLATVTPSDPSLSSAPDARPGPPDLRNLRAPGLPDYIRSRPSPPSASSPPLRTYDPDLRNLRNLRTPGLPDVAYCRTGSCQILWPLHSTSALAPLSLPHPVVRTPSSDLRASDSVPRAPYIGLAPPDPRNLRTTSGRPSPRSSGRPTSLGHSPGSSAPVLRTSGPDPCLVRILGPEPGSPSSGTSGTSGRRPSRLLGS
ncbi:hypothetical protein K438DRAFT_1975427 [Mycena galopus ATCC 62051]|nr:hypothetical protein K438DRAFT_1975427 [Mycena galopus ATCC 62051]